jgi:hypothetical protein
MCQYIANITPPHFADLQTGEDDRSSVGPVRRALAGDEQQGRSVAKKDANPRFCRACCDVDDAVKPGIWLRVEDIEGMNEGPQRSSLPTLV